MKLKVKWTRNRIYALVVALIVLLALFQRLSLVRDLPVDADEPVYAWAASYYAGLMARGEWAEIPQYTYNVEHPVLVKLLYAAGLRLTGYPGLPDQAPDPQWENTFRTRSEEEARSFLNVFRADRTISALFGTLQVLVLALVSPVAGGLLAIHTMTAKYTSQIYLEALPAFSVTLAFLAYDRARRRGEGRTGGAFWLSAAMLGVTAASKYTYIAVSMALVPFVVWQQRRKPWNVLLYGLLALGVFFALNPILWPDPLGRLQQSLLFHESYTGSAEVARYDYAWWQPLNYMSGAAIWHPGAFWFPFDIFTFVVSLVGLPFLFRQNKLYFAWYLTGWLVLFAWPTKWPQYTLIVTPALCLAGGAVWNAIARRFDLRLDRETWERIRYYLPEDSFWIKPSRGLVIGVVVLVVLFGAGYVAVSIIRSQQVRGWTHLTVGEGQLNSNQVSALASGAGGRVWVGTQRGITLYVDGQPEFLQAGSDYLIDNRVTRLAAGTGGAMWVGTEAGVSVALDGTLDGAWRSYTAEEMGLPEARVRALTVDPEGRVWVGTRGGAAMWDGAGWHSFSPTQAGLSSPAVLALAVDRTGRVWMGTDRGLAALDLGAGEAPWRTYTAASSGLPSNGVRALAADPGGGVWVGTGGGGLCLLQGQEEEDWSCYRTSNSDIPWNTITALTVDSQGRVWAATEVPSAMGGTLVVFDGERWQPYSPLNSGLVSGQVSAVTEDGQGRYWFGILGKGVSLFDPSD